MPAKVAFMQLSSCWGCHQSLLNAHLGLLPVLPDMEIVYWPAVVDFKHQSLVDRPDGDVLVGFIEGMVRTEEDRHNVELMRKKCQLVVCFGQCACYGSVKGLANLYSKDDLLKRKFIEADSIGDDNPQIPTENVPPIEEYVKMVDEIIPVDLYIPGCPPKTENIVSAVLHLLGQNFDAPSKPVCEACTLRGDACHLNQGRLCFGPISSYKEGMATPTAAKAELGTYGKSASVAEPEAGKLLELVASVAELDQDQADDLTKFLILYFQLPTLGFMKASADPLRNLAVNPDAYEPKDFEVPGKGSFKGLALPMPDLPEMVQKILGLGLLALRNSDTYKFGTANVCDTCPRVRHNKLLDDIKRDYEGLPNTVDCILDQGYICMGPATKAGCGALCPRVNAPCLGCYGPPDHVKDQGAKMLSTLTSIAEGMEPDQILEKVPDPAGVFYRFTLASGTFFKKFKDTEG